MSNADTGKTVRKQNAQSARMGMDTGKTVNGLAKPGYSQRTSESGWDRLIRLTGRNVGKEIAVTTSDEKVGPNPTCEL